MKLNIIGITGLIGQEVLNLLETFDITLFSKINFIASNVSKGKEIKLKNSFYKIVTLDDIYLKKKYYNKLFKF